MRPPLPRSLIFILTLIVVGGAFALYQCGGQVLVRMATPQGHYRGAAEGQRAGLFEAPKAGWPNRDLPTIRRTGLPDGVVTTKRGEPAATFYVHPTTYLERDRWNAPLDAGGEPSSRTRLFVQSQASAFNGVREIWAPRYRQAASARSC